MDGYTKILGLMKKKGTENNPEVVSLATVVSVPPNLIIQTGDVQITQENILIADYLLSNYSRQINIPANTTATGDTNSVTVGTNGSHQHTITDIGITGQCNFVDTLNEGDQLAVQPIQDGQIYIIFARVVSLDV